MITTKNMDEWQKYGLKLGYYRNDYRMNTPIFLTEKNTECVIIEDYKTRKQYLSYGWRDETRNNSWERIEEPNKIGTFTAKKVAAWMDYIDTLKKRYDEQLSNERNRYATNRKLLLDAGFEVSNWNGVETYRKTQNHILCTVKMHKDGTTFKTFEIPYSEEKALYNEFGMKK